MALSRHENVQEGDSDHDQNQSESEKDGAIKRLWRHPPRHFRGNIWWRHGVLLTLCICDVRRNVVASAELGNFLFYKNQRGSGCARVSGRIPTWETIISAVFYATKGHCTHTHTTHIYIHTYTHTHSHTHMRFWFVFCNTHMHTQHTFTYTHAHTHTNRQIQFGRVTVSQTVMKDLKITAYSIQVFCLT